jgi:hypothetical protein
MAGNRSKSGAIEELIRRGMPPRVLDLDLAAAYVGLSADVFLDAVVGGRYPKPLFDGRRRQWDMRALDAAIHRRSNLGPHARRTETPDDITAAIDGELPRSDARKHPARDAYRSGRRS